MELLAFDTPGLGDNTYVLVHEDVAVVVDPQRDYGRFLAAVDDRAATVRAVFETHVHNDYVSGARALSTSTGADLVLPAGAGATFRFLPAFHLEDLAVGGLTIRPLHTPGHTPEHVSYLVLVENEPLCVFSGGSLLVGAAGRTDLLGMDRAESLARLQFGSINRLAALPDPVALYPTHGPGSFCSVSAVGGTTSTIGQERAANPLLAIADEDAFASSQLAGLQPYPSYYRHMGAVNLDGAGPMPSDAVPVLGPSAIAALMAEGTAVVDARRHRHVAEARIPGAWAIELGASFATWVGWLLPFGSPLVLVLDKPEQVARARTALGRIGFTDVTGVMFGMEEWIADGRPVSLHGMVDSADALVAGDGDAQVLDVRAPDEWESGHLDGSVHRYLPDLVDGPPTGLDPGRPVYVACTSGLRAGTAAALLADAGYRPVVVTGTGIPDIVARTRAAADPTG